MSKQDFSLDEITQVINKLEGKLKDDRLTQQLRNSNVATHDQKPIRYPHENPNRILTNYQPMKPQPQVIYHNYPPQQVLSQQKQQAQFGYTSKAIVGSVPQNTHSEIYQQRQGSEYLALHNQIPNQKILSQNRSSIDLSNRVKVLEQKLREYEQFELNVKQTNKNNQQQFEKLLGIINYQQNEIISLQSQNNQIQHELKQAMETQSMYQKQLSEYKHKVIGLQRMIQNDKGRESVFDKISRNEGFKDMMKNVQGRKVGSPGKIGITLSGSKK